MITYNRNKIYLQKKIGYFPHIYTSGNSKLENFNSDSLDVQLECFSTYCLVYGQYPNRSFIISKVINILEVSSEVYTIRNLLSINKNDKILYFGKIFDEKDNILEKINFNINTSGRTENIIIKDIVLGHISIDNKI